MGKLVSGRQPHTLVLLCLTALALGLAGCGAAQPSPSGSSGRLALSCSSVVGPQGVDVIVARLTCHVSGAPASETAFNLTYHVTGQDSGQPRDLTPVCHGILQDGAGSCEQAYTTLAPNALTPASVSGETTPGHMALGPVTPAERDASPVPGQHL